MSIGFKPRMRYSAPLGSVGILNPPPLNPAIWVPFDTGTEVLIGSARLASDTGTSDSDGLFWDRTGGIERGNSDGIRIGGFLPSMSRRGALLEPLCANVLYPSLPNSSDWTLSGATLAGTTGYFASKGQQAVNLVEDSANSVHQVSRSYLLLQAQPYQCYVVCAIVKRGSAGSARNIVMRHTYAVSSMFGECHYDLGTETATRDTSIGAKVGEQGIDDLGNGYYLCWYSWEQDTAGDAEQVTLTIRLADGTSTTYTGDGVSHVSIHQVEWQEYGYPIDGFASVTPTTPILTTTNQITRATDVLLYQVPQGFDDGAWSAYVAYTPNYDQALFENIQIFREIFGLYSAAYDRGLYFYNGYGPPSRQFRAASFDDGELINEPFASPDWVRGRKYILCMTADMVNSPYAVTARIRDVEAATNDDLTLSTGGLPPQLGALLFRGPGCFRDFIMYDGIHNSTQQDEVIAYIEGRLV